MHADDEADGGRIRRLADDVIAQYAMLTGEEINLFLDADAIKWGEEWRAKIDQGLSSVAFFVAVLTPRYLLSAECRRELQAFASRATSLGVKQLILPLVYVDFPELTAAAPSDDLVLLIRSFQWEDWRELRFEDPVSSGYRKAVANLAKRLVEANRQAEETGTGAPLITGKDELPADDAPGLIDQLGEGEQALAKWYNTIDAIGKNIEVYASAMRASVEDMQRSDEQGKGFAGRLTATRMLAMRIAKPVEAIWSAAQDFVSELNQIDGMMRTLLDLVTTEVKQEPAKKEEVCEFFATVKTMSAAADGSFEHVKSMIDQIGPLEAMSRDLRPIMRRLRQGLTLLLQGKTTINEWVTMIDGSGIECTTD